MTDKFQFYFNSADVKPGKGAGETVADATVYNELAKIKNWRRALSNFAEAPFKWKGYTWKTAEHAYHAAKFENINREAFLKFAQESGSELSRGTGADAQKERKMVKLTKQQITEWDAKKGNILKAIWREKFGQHEPSRNVLMLTGNAELWHRAPRGEAERWEGLEELRAEFRGAAGAAAAAGGGGAGAAADAGRAVVRPAPAAAPPVEEEAPAGEAKDEEEDADQAPAAPAAPEAADVALPRAPVPQPLPPTVAPPLTLPTAGGKPARATLTTMQPGAVATLQQAPPAPPVAQEKDASTLKFCPTCRGYLFLKSTPDALVRLCRKCGYSETEQKGGLVMEMMVQERSSEAYKILINEFTRKDPTLAHIRGPIKCPSAACETNTAGRPRDVIPIRWDEKKLRYLYICDVCGFQWRSRD
jgi:predicted NAD-dependent protein-ADP-ribosyltransferase YbiA (DUF1768 family)/DNA-directed RNA polymerase subunit M/transcription elongation factor TFIIS